MSLICLCLLSLNAQANVAYDNVEIQLVTISPGEYYWSAFGHSAIRIKSPTYDKMFGFGYFNFEDEDFFINFAQGNMQYFLGVVDSKYELEGYKKEGRKTTIQRLLLTSIQKKQLVEKLVFLSKPENRYYHYDYFLNNCTSKIRDILDEVTNGEVSSQLKPIETDSSWNDKTFPVSNQAWVNLGIAYAYGVPAYAIKNKWQLSVFPEDLAEDLKQLKTESKWNSDYEIYYQPSPSELETKQQSFIKTHYAVILVIGFLLVGLLFEKSFKATRIFWLLVQNLMGIGLFMLWFFTQHGVAYWNINLLIFSPFAIMLIFNTSFKPLLNKIFLASNLLWIILALIYTNLYLIGFCLINLLIWKNHKQA